MKRLMSVLTFGLALAVGAVAVEAGQCPLLIKQLREAKVADSKKAAEVKKLTDEAEKLHADGKHAESVAKADEAAKIGGITLTKK